MRIRVRPRTCPVLPPLAQLGHGRGTPARAPSSEGSTQSRRRGMLLTTRNWPSSNTSKTPPLPAAARAPLTHAYSHPLALTFTRQTTWVASVASDRGSAQNVCTSGLPPGATPVNSKARVYTHFLLLHVRVCTRMRRLGTASAPVLCFCGISRWTALPLLPTRIQNFCERSPLRPALCRGALE